VAVHSQQKCSKKASIYTKRKCILINTLNHLLPDPQPSLPALSSPFVFHHTQNPLGVSRSLLMGPANNGASRACYNFRSWEGLWARFAPECRGRDAFLRSHQQLWPHSLAERLPHEKRLRGPPWFSSMCKALLAHGNVAFSVTQYRLLS